MYSSSWRYSHSMLSASCCSLSSLLLSKAWLMYWSSSMVLPPSNMPSEPWNDLIMASNFIASITEKENSSTKKQSSRVTRSLYVVIHSLVLEPSAPPLFRRAHIGFLPAFLLLFLL